MRDKFEGRFFMVQVNMLPHVGGTKHKSNKVIRRMRIAGSVTGSGISTILMSIGLLLVFLLILITTVDYGLYSIKCKILGRGIDYAVASAVQEIDRDRSREGLSGGYDEQTGVITVNDIHIDADRANKIFYTVLSANTGLEDKELKNHMLTAIVTPLHEGMECSFYKEGYSDSVWIERPEMLEQTINNVVNHIYPLTGSDADNRIVFINGNLKTNEFRERPYFIAFIRGFNINGLFRNRKVNYACFAGAKIDRFT